MSHYHIFSPEHALDYARLSVAEVGDGNLNRVFRVVDEDSGRGVIVKQALPYIRSVGESWPLTRDRARIEAQVLRCHGEHCPEYTVALLHHDAEQSVLLLEDLSAMALWRRTLIDGFAPAGAAARLGDYLARVHYHGSDFHLSSPRKRAALARFGNPELCAATEAVFFEHPYRDHSCNRIAQGLRPMAEWLWRDSLLNEVFALWQHCRERALLLGRKLIMQPLSPARLRRRLEQEIQRS
jgi:5-methylthioribose kinase